MTKQAVNCFPTRRDWERDASDRGPEGRSVRHPRPRLGRLACPASSHAMQYSLVADLDASDGADAPQPQPGEGHRLPGVRLARAGPGHRHKNEYCENGAKHVTTRRRRAGSPREFFAEHSVAELEQMSDYWLNQQGRLTEPMVKRAELRRTTSRSAGTTPSACWPGSSTRSTPRTRRCSTPPGGSTTRARSCCSSSPGSSAPTTCRTAPTCATSRADRLCGETLGVGKGTVSLDDIYEADLVLVVGQNPGTNHPRMLTALEETKHNGGQVVAVNPLPEAGLMRFKNPQKPRGVVGPGYGDRRPVPPDPPRRRPRAVPDAQPAAAGGRGRGARDRAGPRTSSSATPPASRPSPQARPEDRLGRRARGDRSDACGDRGAARAGPGRATRSSCAGRWG